MKRTLLLIISIFISIQGFAQNEQYLGQWHANIDELTEIIEESEDDFDANGTMTLTLTKDKYEEYLLLNIKMEDDVTPMSFTFKINIIGTWNLIDNNLTLTPNKKIKPNVEIEVTGIPDFLKGLFVNPLKKEFIKEFYKQDNYRIISVSDSELVLEDILTEKEMRDKETASKLNFTKQQ